MNSGKASDLAMSHLGSLECHLDTGIVPNAIKRKSLLLQLEFSVNAQPFRFRQTSPLLTPAFQQFLHGSPQKGWPERSCPPTSRLCPAAPGTQLPHVWLRKSLSRKSWSQQVNLKLSPDHRVTDPGGSVLSAWFQVAVGGPLGGRCWGRHGC